ncbi:BatA domain-containing protein [Hanstruepera marina]|uniref:BatA domain-containing protein n=1 Tax=Hanstruepera marina TaxID=2873265 RepID=UPI001CA72B2B|nr:BatA domain-containing protein [Hanstruepera marina]
MQFKHPEILYAIFILVIPIIIHLFQLRRFRKQAFTNVAFLKKVTLQTRKSSQIKKWLTLLTRLLLLACIVIAFAQPYFSQKNVQNTKPENIIYLDNSFSMQAKGEKGTLLNRAIQEIIENLDETEEFTLITNDKTFKNTNLKAIQNELLQLSYSSNQLPYEAALLKGNKLFSKDGSRLKNFVFISDFQLKDNDFPINVDSLFNIKLAHLKPVNSSNASIDSVFIANYTNNNTVLKAVINSNTPNSNTLPVSLYDGENLLAKTAVELVDGAATAEFTITNPLLSNGLISIDDNGLQFDNTFYFNINKPSKINTLVISQEDASFLSKIYNDNEFEHTETTLAQLNYSDIDKQNLIVLNELSNIPNSLSNSLKVFEEKGGLVIVIPSLDAEVESYASFLNHYGINFMPLLNSEKHVTKINFSHPIFDNVFDKQVSNFQYPKVNSYHIVNTNTSNQALSFEDNRAFLLQAQRVFVFSAALNSENSNFKQSPLIVPTFYNIAQQSLQMPKLYYTIGNPNSFDIATTLQQDAVLSLKKGDLNLIPQQQYFNNKVSVFTHEVPDEAGVYSVIDKDTVIENVSYNYNREESNLTYQDISNFNQASISNSVAKVFTTIKSESKINELWKWFIIFALAFLIIEMLILKYFK